MNKYFILIILGVLIVGGGIVYKMFLASEESAPVTTGNVKEITITARQNEWRFEPETFEIDRGDKVMVTVINEDDYDHGIAIDAFGISQRMPAKSDPKTKGVIKFEFVATQAGEFPFYCSVPCGEGEVNGVKRTHFDMVGKIKVRDIISVNQNNSGVDIVKVCETENPYFNPSDECKKTILQKYPGQNCTFSLGSTIPSDFGSCTECKITCL